MVKVQVSDVNDNRPTFYPRQYKVSLPESEVSSGALVAVAATDADSGTNGRIRYSIVGGNTHGLFRIDPSTGEVRGSGTWGVKGSCSDLAPALGRFECKRFQPSLSKGPASSLIGTEGRAM